MTGLRLLVVDDEQPALDELEYLLTRDPRVHTVTTCASATEALRVLREHPVDGVFLDIRMPGLSGVEVAGVLANFKEPPPIVFVTAHDEHAVDAFGLDAVDYVLKPVREERIAEAVRRLGDRGPARREVRGEGQVAVELGGVTRFVARDQIGWVEAHGDYARLHVVPDAPGGASSHLVRTPLTTLAETWADAGFVRIHRSLLVNLAHVAEVRMDGGRCSVLVGGEELVVSRRHTRELRDLLVRQNRPGAP
ncbi:MAG: lytR [Nocardioidaceae bacterium]|nr:lytR [Nocardioidaceae bacterium]